MWCKFLLISDKKYDLGWITEYEELMEAQKWNEDLSEENERNYQLLSQRFEKFYFDTEIPETYYCELNDEGIIRMYGWECEKYGDEEYLNDVMNSIKKCETKNDSKAYKEYLEKEYEKYSKPAPTIEEYVNSMEEYVVRDGKVYTTKNYMDGIIDFFARKEWSDLISKSGVHSPCLKAGEIDIEASEVGSAALVIDDTDLSYRYADAKDNTDTEEQFYQKTVETIKNLPPEKYVYSFGYHF